MKALVVVGYQPEKLQFLKKRDKDKLDTWIQANQQYYDYTISIVRVGGNKVLESSGKDILYGNDNNDLYPFQIDKRIETKGFCFDDSTFNGLTDYTVIGISTAASVLGTVYEINAVGARVHVIKDLCFDRKGLNKEAFKILEAYIPGVFD